MHTTHTTHTFSPGHLSSDLFRGREQQLGRHSTRTGRRLLMLHEARRSRSGPGRGDEDGLQP